MEIENMELKDEELYETINIGMVLRLGRDKAKEIKKMIDNDKDIQLIYFKWSHGKLWIKKSEGKYD